MGPIRRYRRHRRPGSRQGSRRRLPRLHLALLLDLLLALLLDQLLALPLGLLLDLLLALHLVLSTFSLPLASLPLPPSRRRRRPLLGGTAPARLSLRAAVSAPGTPASTDLSPLIRG